MAEFNDTYAVILLIAAVMSMLTALYTIKQCITTDFGVYVNGNGDNVPKFERDFCTALGIRYSVYGYKAKLVQQIKENLFYDTFVSHSYGVDHESLISVIKHVSQWVPLIDEKRFVNGGKRYVTRNWKKTNVQLTLEWMVVITLPQCGIVRMVSSTNRTDIQTINNYGNPNPVFCPRFTGAHSPKLVFYFDDRCQQNRDKATKLMDMLFPDLGIFRRLISACCYKKGELFTSQLKDLRADPEAYEIVFSGIKGLVERDCCDHSTVKDTSVMLQDERAIVDRLQRDMNARMETFMKKEIEHLHTEIQSLQETIAELGMPPPRTNDGGNNFIRSPMNPQFRK